MICVTEKWGSVACKDRVLNDPDLARMKNELQSLGKNEAVTLEHWDEDKTQFKPLLYLDASTYRVDPLFDVADPECVVSPNSTFAYCNRWLPEGMPLKIWERPGQNGIVFWNGDIVNPCLIDLTIESRSGCRFPTSMPYPERVQRGAVWMSLTPLEMLSQRSGIKRAKGKVLVGGLGMGWFLRKVCEKPEVEEVIVVEISKDLLDWYGYDVCRKHPKVSEVICDNVYNHFGRHGNAQYLLDIWPISQGALSDRQYRAAKRKWGKRIWAWGVN